jgi:hypothetical protein
MSLRKSAKSEHRNVQNGSRKRRSTSRPRRHAKPPSTVASPNKCWVASARCSGGRRRRSRSKIKREGDAALEVDTSLLGDHSSLDHGQVPWTQRMQNLADIHAAQQMSEGQLDSIQTVDEVVEAALRRRRAEYEEDGADPGVQRRDFLHEQAIRYLHRARQMMP